MLFGKNILKLWRRNMRLIDADKLEDVLAKHQTRYYVYSDYYEGISQGFNLARYDVKEAPTIEVALIVGERVENDDSK